MRKLFKERKLFKAGNYMRKYGKYVLILPSSLSRYSLAPKTKRIFQMLWCIFFIFSIYPPLSAVLSTWTEPDILFGWIHLAALSKHFKRSNLAQNFFELHAWIKKCHLAIFQKGLEWPCLVSAALEKCIIAFERFFLFWVPINI